MRPRSQVEAGSRARFSRDRVGLAGTILLRLLFNLAEYALEHNRRVSVIRNYRSYGTAGNEACQSFGSGRVWRGRGKNVLDRLALESDKGGAVP